MKILAPDLPEEENDPPWAKVREEIIVFAVMRHCPEPQPEERQGADRTEIREDQAGR